MLRLDSPLGEGQKSQTNCATKEYISNALLKLCPQVAQERLRFGKGKVPGAITATCNRHWQQKRPLGEQDVNLVALIGPPASPAAKGKVIP